MRTKYDQETKDRVIRMFYERRQEVPGESMRASLRHLHDLTGISPDTMRGWVDRARVDAREKPGVTTAEREEIRALRKEVAELMRANEILKTASAFFAAAELDRHLK
jgi:transposase